MPTYTVREVSDDSAYVVVEMEDGSSFGQVVPVSKPAEPTRQAKQRVVEFVQAKTARQLRDAIGLPEVVAEVVADKP